MAKAIEFKPEELLARSYVDRLILRALADMESAVKLSEIADRLVSQNVGLSTIRSLLYSNEDRFTYHERRWIPAARLEGAGRPLTAMVVLSLDRFGGPMPLDLLIQEIARITKQSPESLDNVLRRVIKSDPSLLITPREEVALSRWGFDCTDEGFERGLALNRVSLEEFEAAQEKLKDINWRSENAVQEALQKAAPIRMKVLGAVAWAQLNPRDPKAILLYSPAKMTGAFLSADGFVFASDGVIYPASETKKWISTTVKMADRIAPMIEVEDVAPIDVKPDDIKRMATRIAESEKTVTALRLLEEFYEITPGNKTFPDDMTNIMVALKSSPQVQWVGGDRFRSPVGIPDYIYSVPEPFHFVEKERLDEEGEPIDVILSEDGLSSSLRKLLQHSLATDVLDEDIQPVPKSMPESLRLVLKSIHRELGTFPMCQFPTGWLDSEPQIQEIVLVDQNGRELSAWVNTEARLIFGLIDWWFEQPIESGAVFTLSKTLRSNVFDFAWSDQADPVLFVSSARMEELRQLSERADEMSALDILIEVMGHYPKGADFLTVLAEINVVRRTRRLLVASLLSSYHCFYQRSGSPVWHFDAKKVDQGFDKTKKKYIIK